MEGHEFEEGLVPDGHGALVHAGRDHHDGSMDRVTGPKESGTGLAVKRHERAAKNHLERPHVRARLIRDLAVGELKQYQLAKLYKVSPGAITGFKQRHDYEITEVVNALADEYAGLWVAKKLDRISAYQQAAEDMLAGKTARSAEVLVTILKAVAEELGDLPARTQVNVSTENVTYQIIGVDPEDLT